MPRHRISIVRTADRLHELVHETSASSTADEPWRIAQRVMLQPHEASPRLAAAWQALACVTAWNDETLRHVTTILVDTVPSGDDAGELAALGDVEPPAPPRATAAHPRAYRGTKHKPAKPARTRPVDVRGYLLPGLLCQGKGGCFRSQNHRPKGRVCGGSSRAKKGRLPLVWERTRRVRERRPPLKKR
jgi:hypothetical protein